MTVPDDWVPDECTLPTGERPLRMAEFDDLFISAVRFDRPQPTRLDLTLPRTMEADARSLADRESQCCTFFAFSFKPDGGDVVMHIEVPSTRTDVLDTIEARIAR
jgi:hypothetical protein